MAKIEKMTEAQTDLMISFREEWRQIGICCEPADKRTAENAIKKMYEKLGKNPPIFLWFSSPMTANIMMNVYKHYGSLEKFLGANLRANLGANLWANLGDNLRDNLWANLRDNLRANLGDNLRDNLRANLGDNLWANLWDNLRDNLGDNLWANLGDNLWEKKLECFGTDAWGQMDVYWICYYLFPALHLGVKHKPEDMDTLNLWADVSKSCGWWWPHENICIISDRPKSISFDEQWQLHSEIGPALLFRDGYSVYANHNVRHEGWFVEHPETITADKIAAEENIEIRRIMIEKMGHGQYLQETGAQIVDMDSIPIGGGVDGAIIRALLKDKNGLQFLCGSDGSTNRVYYMSVDPNAKTCGQAHESICGFPEHLIIANA